MLNCAIIIKHINKACINLTHIQNYPPLKTEPHPAATGHTKQQNATTAIKPSRNNDPLQKAASKGRGNPTTTNLHTDKTKQKPLIYINYK
jgi:hypothetical protein